MNRIVLSLVHMFVRTNSVSTGKYPIGCKWKLAMPEDNERIVRENPWVSTSGMVALTMVFRPVNIAFHSFLRCQSSFLPFSESIETSKIVARLFSNSLMMGSGLDISE